VVKKGNIRWVPTSPIEGKCGFQRGIRAVVKRLHMGKKILFKLTDQSDQQTNKQENKCLVVKTQGQDHGVGELNGRAHKKLGGRVRRQIQERMPVG